MGLFQKSKNNNFELMCEKMANELINLYKKSKGVSFENISELERQILVVYFFGMSDGLRQDLTTNSNVNEIANIIINVMVKEFKYSKEQAEQFFIKVLMAIFNGKKVIKMK